MVPLVCGTFSLQDTLGCGPLGRGVLGCGPLGWVVALLFQEMLQKIHKVAFHNRGASAYLLT
jgi:hypothetical protein